MDVLEKLGGKCAKCGLDDYRTLQIDHIDGCGSAEIKALGLDKMYRKILIDPSGYQILCANCNWIKAFENNEFKRKGLQQTISQGEEDYLKSLNYEELLKNSKERESFKRLECPQCGSQELIKWLTIGNMLKSGFNLEKVTCRKCDFRGFLKVKI